MSDAVKQSKEIGNKAVGCCKDGVVQLDYTLSVICLCVNIIPGMAGIGTCISACAGDKFSCCALLLGLLQWLLGMIIIGWIWAIIHGLWIYKARK